MLKYFYLLLPFALLAQKQEPINFINPYIGTTGDHPTEYGGVMPVVAPPFAMTQWTAATRENKIGSCAYRYDDTTIMGFQGTHQPAVWMGDYGMVSIMPEIGTLKTGKNRALLFSHAREMASPYLYNVQLTEKTGKNIDVTMAATSRCAIFSFQFPADTPAHLYIEASREKNFVGYVEIDTLNKVIWGYNPDRHSAAIGTPLTNFKGYFYIQYSQQATGSGAVFHTRPNHGKTKQWGEKCGAYLSFRSLEENTLLVKVATSFISLEQAKQNLEREIPHWNITKVADDCKAQWQTMLNRITVESIDSNQLVNFYTAIYHSLQFPREFSEYGQYYSSFDDKIHEGISYNDYSLWGTYRALHPLLIFLAPERVNPMIQSLLEMYQQGGWLPKWPNPTYTNIMIKSHADAVIADAYVKGFREYDLNLAWEAIYKNTTTPPVGDTINTWADRAPWTHYESRGGLTWYN